MADCHCEGDRKDANQRVAGRDRLVMLSKASHLAAERARSFAALEDEMAQGDNREHQPDPSLRSG